jgi:hypothetical protein
MNFLRPRRRRVGDRRCSYKRVSKALRDNPQAKLLKIRANSFGGNASKATHLQLASGKWEASRDGH